MRKLQIDGDRAADSDISSIDNSPRISAVFVAIPKIRRVDPSPSAAGEWTATHCREISCDARIDRDGQTARIRDETAGQAGSTR
jgi:hypothetical protein